MKYNLPPYRKINKKQRGDETILHFIYYYMTPTPPPLPGYGERYIYTHLKCFFQIFSYDTTYNKNEMISFRHLKYFFSDHFINNIHLKYNTPNIFFQINT